MEKSLRENVEVKRATYGDKTVLRHLLELYNYDFSEFNNADVDEHGLFGYSYLDHYWVQENRHPFLIRVAGKHAGFALVKEKVQEGRLSAFFMAEFFVMRKYRGQGISDVAACSLFALHPGDWTISETGNNQPAQRFWRKVIDRYTGGNFEEIQADGWDGVIQTFTSESRSPIAEYEVGD